MTKSLQRQLAFWVVALAALVLVLLVLRDILLPFVAGLALAYFLDPVADRLEKLGASRLVATAVILATFILVFVLGMLVIVPALSQQVSRLAANFPSYVDALTRFIDESIPAWLKAHMAQGDQGAGGSASELATKGAAWTGTLLKTLWSGGMALVSVASLVIVTPVVAFYMLYDWDRMVQMVDNWLPRDHAPAIRQIARDIDVAMAGFIRGQGTVCILLGIFYAIGLTLAGLNFGLLIGFASGLLSFIPFVGAIVGLVASVGVALVQFWPDWVMVVVVAAIFGFGQFLEGNFLSPRLVGDSVGLHPVWLIFSLFAFGYLFGFVGMLVAIPLAAAIGVVTRFLLQMYLRSPLYLGTDGGKDHGSQD
jgi:predicted PurR-regulated permease PerM